MFKFVPPAFQKKQNLFSFNNLVVSYITTNYAQSAMLKFCT